MGKQVQPFKKARAKFLYMQHWALPAIADDTGLSVRTISSWVDGKGGREGWRKEREKAFATLITDARDRSRNDVVEIVTLGTKILKTSLKRQLDHLEGGEKRMLETKELMDLSAIITNLDKLQRLDAGKPTEIQEHNVGYHPISIEDLRKAVDGDPFLDLDAIPMKKGEDYGAVPGENLQQGSAGSIDGESGAVLGAPLAERGEPSEGAEPEADES